MKIAFNYSAVVAQDALSRTESALSRSTERLSSGYKINAAKDNPSGLAIARKMRAQLKSLSQATDNANNGISVVEIADGALTEVHEMLQRMNELAIKGANGTVSDSDRQAIQAEINQLSDEINRIADTTEFNGSILMNGNFDLKGYVEKLDNKDFDSTNIKVGSYSDNVRKGYYGVTFHVKAAKVYQINDTGTYVYDTLASAKASFAAVGTAYSVDRDSYKTEGTTNGVNNPKTKVDTYGSRVIVKADDDFELIMDVEAGKLLSDLEAENYKTAFADKRTDLEVSDLDKLSADRELFGWDGEGSLNDYIHGIDKADTTGKYTKAEIEFKTKLDEFEKTVYDGSGKVESRDYVVKYNDDGNVDYYTCKIDTAGDTVKTLYDGSEDPAGTAEIQFNRNKEVTSVACEYSGYTLLNLTGDGDMTVTIGTSGEDILDIRIPKVSCRTLGIENLDMTSQKSCKESIDRVASAIDNLSKIRSRLGAYQNRLEHTVASLDVSSESMTSAYSRIMDTDMAEEMTEYTTYNVLNQAGISVLSQANERPSQILQLLQ